MPDKLRISVITVVRNGEKEIRRTIESILYQSIFPYEYLVIDGASHDKTVDIAKEYTVEFEEHGIQFEVFSEPDNGIYDGMNKGIVRARGNFIAFLNAGDYYERQAIEIVNRTYDNEPFDFCYGSIFYVNTEGTKMIKRSKKDKIISSRNWNHPSSFIKKELYEKYNFCLGYKYYADFDLYLKLRKLNIDIVILPPTMPIANFICDGVSTASGFRCFLERTREKKKAYLRNGYNKVYLIEVYAWEVVKYVFCCLYGWKK